jgi:multiple sugar transport system substrate-binding protein
MAVALAGMTWNHPRGYDPLVAAAETWRDRTGVSISWDKRSLQDFESYPIEELAARYDFIVIDHPHVGQVARESCLVPLDDSRHADAAAALANASVGASYASYRWNGRQWALPIDAATQVQAWRPDRLAAPAASWDQVRTLAKAGRVICPLRPPHSLMAFYTLCGNLGRACTTAGSGDHVDPETGIAAFALLRELSAAIDPACLDMDPIAVFERMAEDGSAIACAPLIYGYVSYARLGFRAARLAFADIPLAPGAAGPVGSVLGGTGIAVSARTAHAREAVNFAYWVAGAECQRGLYAEAGGQPGHAAAWEDASVNAAAGDFYRNTRRTLEGAWVRPRHDGYMAFQEKASERINRALRAGEAGERLIADLNALFRESLRPAVPMAAT